MYPMYPCHRAHAQACSSDEACASKPKSDGTDELEAQIKAAQEQLAKLQQASDRVQRGVRAHRTY